MFTRISLLLLLALGATAAQLRINCGGPFLPNIGWRRDTGKYSNTPVPGYVSPTPVLANGNWAPVYASHSYSFDGDLVYKIPVPAGVYKVYMLFSEVWSAAVAGTRQFNVDVNGVMAFAKFDVYAEANGGFKPVFKTVPVVNAANGFITVTLGRLPGKNNPMISGIVIEGANPAALVGTDGLGQASSPMISPTVAPTVPACSVTSVLLNAGGPAVAGYGADNVKYIDGAAGAVYTSSAAVTVPAGSTTAPLYLTERFTDAAALTYKVPVSAGKYTVTTMHSESYFMAAGKRVFDITINGIAKKTNLDIFAAAGNAKNVAVEQTFSGITAVNGFVTISFMKKVQNPVVNAIKITSECGTSSIMTVSPSASLVPTPSSSAVPVVDACLRNAVLLNCGGLAVSGYSADNIKYIQAPAGSVYTSSVPATVPAGSNTAPLYLTERFTTSAALTYKIPVAPGVYTVTTMHAESYFTLAGKRVFDIKINGAVVQSQVDLFVSGKAKNVAVDLTFPGISPVAGFITISFVKRTQNPLVNAIKIIPNCGIPVIPTISPRPSPPVCETGRLANAFRMNIGGPASSGYGAENTAYLVGTSSQTTTNSAVVTTALGGGPANLYKTERFTTDFAMRYKIPAPAGTYTVTTEHAETYFNAAGGRSFSITINGVVVRPKVDVFVIAGGKNKAVALEFPNVSSVSGFINIAFVRGAADNPFVNAIKITGPGADKLAIAGGC